VSRVDLDDRLRELFRDDRLDLPVRPGADTRIVAGARRRRQVRVGVAGAAAAVVLLGGAVGAAGLRLPGSEAGAPPGPATVTVSVGPQALEPPAHANFRLGMTDAEARATGALVLPGHAGKCVAYSTKDHAGDAVIVSPRSGVVRITLPPLGYTPSGIGAGSSLQEVRRAYPGVAVEGDRAVVLMGEDWRYVFPVAGGSVTAVWIERVGSECGLEGS